MEGEVGKRALECILMPAMLAARNVRAQRDRLLQLRRRLQRSPGPAHELAADLFKVYAHGLKHGAGYLTGCLELAYDNDADLSFCNPAFAYVPEEQLYATLLAHRLPPRQAATQTDAFTRLELAYYAVNLALSYHVPRCVELLVGVRPPAVSGRTDGCMVGYSDDTLAAATDHIFKTRLSDMAPPDDAPDRRLSNPAADDADTERIPKTRPRLRSNPAATDDAERTAKTRPRLFDRPAPDADTDTDTDEDPAAPTTWEPPQVASSKDPDQALSYLHRACSLASLAAKHIDAAVAVISTFLDDKEVAETAEMADEDVYISEDGPYQTDE